MTDTNPWALTPAEMRTMRQMLRYGSAATIAKRTDIRADTVHDHLGSVRKKMPKIHYRRPTTVQCVAAFAAWEGRQC